MARGRAVAACVGVSALALLLALGPAVHHLAVAAAVLAKVTGMQLPAAWERRLLLEVSEAQLVLRTSSGEVRARRYTPRDPHRRSPPVLLLHGVHAMGIEEPRLVALARALAQGGLEVITPELTQLTRYEVDASLVREIHELASAGAAASGTVAVGVIGISFAGGLALMAAAEQVAKRRPIGFVVSVGAHADLLRVCDYYAGRDVRGPDGEHALVAPHPYGARVMLRQHLGRLISAPDLPRAQAALDTYLHDKPQAARRMAQQLTPESRKVMDVLLDSGGSDALSAWLLEVARSEREQLLAASPHGHLAGLKVPVLLLHGSADPVIPSLETRYLAREIPAPALQVALISDLLRHAEFPSAPAPRQAYLLARFMQRLFGVAGGMERASSRE